MNRAVAVIAGVAGLWFLLIASPRSLGEAALKYAFAAVLLYFAYRRFRSSSKKTAEYVKQADGAGLRFDVSPAAAPILWFPAVLAVVLGGGIIGSGMPYLWVLGMLFPLVTWLVLVKDQRGGNADAARSFRVNQDGIETEGVLLRKEDIHQLTIRNKFAGNFEVVYDADRGLSTGAAMGLAGRRALAEVAYRVEAEAGGKAHVLAAGLDETTARGVVADVGKVLNSGAPAS